MNNTFFPLAFRMKYIHRWGLMRNTEQESLLEHSAECAMLAHVLAEIGNTYFGKQYDVGDMAVKALYHDISEIYTGDLPTPVKYHNEYIRSSYKEIEQGAVDKLLLKLPTELQPGFSMALDHESDPETAKIVKAADKLCAFIKCIKETENGNKEFTAAYAGIEKALFALAEDCQELAYFMKHFLDEFKKPLDEL